MLAQKTIAIVGAGKLGQALINGLLDSGAVQPDKVVATRNRLERLDELVSTRGIRTAKNGEAAKCADIIVLCVKPQDMESTLKELAPHIRPGQLLISVAACVTTGLIESHCPPGVPVVRTMPNTPCLLRRGMTALAPGVHASSNHLECAKTIFDSLGRTVVLEEKQLDAVTGLSGSGPAYAYIVIEALAEAGVKVGLPRHVATELVAQTFLGSASMVLETGQHPALLKDMVTTPAGCTMDGILALEDGGIRVTLIKAVMESVRRASELLEDR